MAIEITLDFGDKLISINTSHSNYFDLKKLENLYYHVVRKALESSVVSLITQDPRPYSFAQGLGVSMEYKVNNRKVLLTGSCELETGTLMSVIESEEFRRGLLLLTGIGLQDLLPHVDTVLEISNTVNLDRSLPFSLIFCADDGNTLYLYNTKLTHNELQTMINQSEMN